MILKKKAEFDEVILKLAVVIAILIIAIWFVTFIGGQTLEDQNMTFNSLNIIIEHYSLVCAADEVNISGIQITMKKGSMVEIEDNRVCVVSRNVIKTCTYAICNQTISKEFKLNNEISYFSFAKASKDGGIEIGVQ